MILYDILKAIFWFVFRLLFRADISGRENLPQDGPVILAANHLSNWDPPLLACFLSRPVSYMAKVELFEHPLFGAAIRNCHAFPVRRAQRTAVPSRQPSGYSSRAMSSGFSLRARAAKTDACTRRKPALACSRP